MVALWSEARPVRCVECGAPLSPVEIAADADACDDCRIEALAEEVARIQSEAAAERIAERLAAAEARRVMRATIDAPVW